MHASNIERDFALVDYDSAVPQFLALLGILSFIVLVLVYAVNGSGD